MRSIYPGAYAGFLIVRGLVGGLKIAPGEPVPPVLGAERVSGSRFFEMYRS
jgi:hypothetical protein